MELGASHIDAVTAGVWNVLRASHDTDVVQYSSHQFQRTESNWIANPCAGLLLTEDTQWKRLDGSSAPVAFSGRLIGGCLDTVARIAGTQYGDLPGFVKSSAGDGVVLYIENAEMPPCELLRALWSVRLHGWLDDLRSACEGISCPVLHDLDIGHLPPQLSLVNGAVAHITFKNNSGSVTQRLGH